MHVVEQIASNRRFHEIRLTDVANEAKIGKGTIYQYFEGKEDLFFQVAVSGFDELCHLLEENVPESGDFNQKLSTVCDQISNFFAARYQLLQIMQNEAAHLHLSGSQLKDQWQQKKKKLVKLISAILEDGVRQQIIRSDIPIDQLVEILLGMLRTAAVDVDGSIKYSQRKKLPIDLFLTGAYHEENNRKAFLSRNK
jgi:TetR/AcrR family fatty acid metabolism transcriptional regulator